MSGTGPARGYGPPGGPVAGLCAACVHARVTTNRRGSTFWLCRRSVTDPAFPRYPRLPVVSCPGFERAPAPDPPEEEIP